MFTIIPDPKYPVRDGLRGWRRWVHFFTRFPFHRARLAITNDYGQIYTHPDNVSFVTEYLRELGHPFTVAAPRLASVAELKPEARK